MEIIKSNPLIPEIKINSALKRRKLFLNDELDGSLIFETLYFLDRIIELDNKEREINVLDFNLKPVEIIINSVGGSVIDGLALVSKICEMKELGYKIICTTSAIAASMAFVILIVGSHRRSYRYATHMIHQPSSHTFNTLKEMEDDIEEIRRLWDIIKNIVANNSNITKQKLDEIYNCKKDWYLSSQEALELSVIDEIA